MAGRCALRLEQRPGFLQVGRLEALGEPAVEGGQQLVGLRAFTLPLPGSTQAQRRWQFPRLGVLIARDGDGLAEARFGCACGSSGAAGCGAGGVMAWERGAGKGREGAEGVDVDYALEFSLIKLSLVGSGWSSSDMLCRSFRAPRFFGIYRIPHPN